MRYTRYDYKRKKKSNFLGWLCLVILLSILIGVSVFKIFFGGGESTPEVPGKLSNEKVVNNTQEVKSYGIVQGGLYSSKDGAESLLTTLPSNYLGFVVEEDGKFKAMAGIFFEENLEVIMKELTDLSINNFRIKCDIKQDSKNNKLKGEIIDGYLKIINKLYEKDVKSYNTSEFKGWVNELIKNLEVNDDEMKEIVENINLLPDEYKKENGKESLLFLYKILIKNK